MKQTHKRLVMAFWGVVVAVIIVTSLLSSTHPPTKFNLDKLLHFGAYGFLAFLPALAVGSRDRLLWLVAFLIIVGAGTEIGQLFVSGRSGTLGDFAANVLGIASGMFAGRFARRWLHRHWSL